MPGKRRRKAIKERGKSGMAEAPYMNIHYLFLPCRIGHVINVSRRWTVGDKPYYGIQWEALSAKFDADL